MRTLMKWTLTWCPSTLVLALSACHEETVVSAPPPPQVKVATVLQRDVPVYVEAIGETRGNTEIEIRARVEGFVDSVDFVEGSLVAKGQRLYTIDPRPFETAVAQAKASVAEAEAQLARTRQDVARYEPLVAKNAISREEYETAVALERAAKATLDAMKALQERAEIDLSYTHIIAPEDGLIGKTEVYAGTLVGRGQSTLMTRISRIDPIHVRFTFSEKDYLALAREQAVGERPASEKRPFDLVLADGSRHPHGGQIAFVDRAVDPRTGTILGEAAFPNPERIVRPGQYARVRVLRETKPGAILVPQGAVQELQGVYSVMVVSSDSKIEQRLVQPGRRMDSLWVIESGLKAGEKIVVEGLQRVRPGIQVTAQTVLIGEDATDAAGAEAEEPAPAPTTEPAGAKAGPGEAAAAE
jgi:membrane fusion protein (multidrug efflux system)